MSDTEKICYVCFEDCEELSRCGCKNIYLHIRCQKDIIDRNNDYKCTICKEEYSNVVYANIVTDYNYNCRKSITLISFLSFTLFMTLSEILIGIYVIKDFKPNYILVLYICVTSITATFLLYIKIRLLILTREMCYNNTNSVNVIY